MHSKQRWILWNWRVSCSKTVKLFLRSYLIESLVLKFQVQSCFCPIININIQFYPILHIPSQYSENGGADFYHNKQAIEDYQFLATFAFHFLPHLPPHYQSLLQSHHLTSDQNIPCEDEEYGS